MAARRRSKSKAGAKTLKDVARTIGSTLGEVKSRSEKVVRGLKAAAEASKKAYVKKANPRKRTARPSAKKKSRAAS